MKNYESPLLEIELFFDEVVRCSTVNDKDDVSGSAWIDPWA